MTVRQATSAAPDPDGTAPAHRARARARGPEPMHPAERRMRDAGGPDDRACYSCGCGFSSVAPVSTSVHCPHCDTVQAW